MTTFIIGLTALTAVIVTSVLGFVMIPFLKRLKFGQTIKEIGPTWHKKKQGIPTMGGLIFWAGIIAASIIGYVAYYNTASTSISGFDFLNNAKFFAGIALAVEFGVVGFIDDYIKVVKKRNLGLKARQKTFMQIIIAITYIATLYLSGDNSTIVIFPILGGIDIGFFYYPIAVTGIYFMVNAVNITDGIDGLCGSVTFVAAIIFMFVSRILNDNGMTIFSIAVAGGCLGFLVWNFYPAKVFMGDTGSMFLGGAMVAIAFGLGMPVIIFLVGIVYIIEALSVVIQVAYFKYTKKKYGNGKRIFKMSPIHHHFEMCKWSEVKIVTAFTIFSFAMGLIAVIAVFYDLHG